VVIAAQGYPLQPRHGDTVGGLPTPAPDAFVFHAGTALRDGQLVSSGGRILCVTTLADNLRQAQQRAYELVQGLSIDGMQYRTDIGHRALKASSTAAG
jgi:phosphoribosylamine--glycine ligase